MGMKGKTRETRVGTPIEKLKAPLGMDRVYKSQVPSRSTLSSSWAGLSWDWGVCSVISLVSISPSRPCQALITLPIRNTLLSTSQMAGDKNKEPRDWICLSSCCYWHSTHSPESENRKEGLPKSLSLEPKDTKFLGSCPSGLKNVTPCRIYLEKILNYCHSERQLRILLGGLLEDSISRAVFLWLPRVNKLETSTIISIIYTCVCMCIYTHINII